MQTSEMSYPLKVFLGWQVCQKLLCFTLLYIISLQLIFKGVFPLFHKLTLGVGFVWLFAKRDKYVCKYLKYPLKISFNGAVSWNCPVSQNDTLKLTGNNFTKLLCLNWLPEEHFRSWSIDLFVHLWGSFLELSLWKSVQGAFYNLVPLKLTSNGDVSSWSMCPSHTYFWCSGLEGPPSLSVLKEPSILVPSCIHSHLVISRDMPMGSPC